MESQDESRWDSEPDYNQRFSLMKSKFAVDSQEDSAADYHKDFYKSQVEESPAQAHREFYSESQEESHDCHEDNIPRNDNKHCHYHHSHEILIPIYNMHAGESSDDESDNIYDIKSELPDDIYSGTYTHLGNKTHSNKSSYNEMLEKRRTIQDHNDESVDEKRFKEKKNYISYNYMQTASLKKSNSNAGSNDSNTSNKSENRRQHISMSEKKNEKRENGNRIYNTEIENDDSTRVQQNLDRYDGNEYIKHKKQVGHEKRVRIIDSESNDENCNIETMVMKEKDYDSEVVDTSEPELGKSVQTKVKISQKYSTNSDDGRTQHKSLSAIPLFIIPPLGPGQRIEDWEPLFRAAVTGLLNCDGGESLAINLLPAYVNRRPAEVEVSKDVLKVSTLDDAFELMRSLDEPIDKYDAMQNLCRAYWESGVSFDDFFYILRKQAIQAGADNDLLVAILINQLPCQIQVIAKDVFMTLKGKNQVITNENTKKFVFRIKQMLTKRGIGLDSGKADVTESESSDFSSLNVSNDSSTPQQQEPVEAPQHKQYVKVKHRKRTNQVCCFVCNKPGHKEIDCTSQYCQRCGVYGHGRVTCLHQTPIKSCLSVKFCDKPIILDADDVGSSRKLSRLKSNIDHKRAISIVNRSSVSLSTLTDRRFGKFLCKPKCWNN